MIFSTLFGNGKVLCVIHKGDVHRFGVFLEWCQWYIVVKKSFSDCQSSRSLSADARWSKKCQQSSFRLKLLPFNRFESRENSFENIFENIFGAHSNLVNCVLNGFRGSYSGWWSISCNVDKIYEEVEKAEKVENVKNVDGVLLVTLKTTPVTTSCAKSRWLCLSSVRSFLLRLYIYICPPPKYGSLSAGKFVKKFVNNFKNVDGNSAQTSNPHVECLLQKCGDIELNPGPANNYADSIHPFQPSTSTSPASTTVITSSTPTENGDRDPDHHLHQVVKSDLQVLTLNVRGLSDPKKVRHLVNTCYKRTKQAKDSFFLFQETYVPSLGLLDYIWRGDYYLTPGTGNSLGCISLISPPYKIIQSRDIEQRGHVLALSKTDINKVDCILVNIYAPNGFDELKIKFFEKAIETVCEMKDEMNCGNVFMAGDFNLVFSTSEVMNRRITVAEERVAEIVRNLLSRCQLIDGWGILKTSSFTWGTSRTGSQAFSTLDRVCFASNEYALIEKECDWSASLSDHAAVIARFNSIQKATSHKTVIPRLDARLLNDETGRKMLREAFDDLIDQMDASWNPHVKLEYCKMSIRTAANTVTGKIKARYRDEEKILNQDINNLVEQLAEANTPADLRLLLIHKLNDLRQLKRILVAKIGTRIEQRNARKWYSEGELSNKYFFNILNRPANDEIKVVLNEDGVEIKTVEGIEQEVVVFYKKLYENVDEVRITDDFFSNITPVAPELAASVEADLTLEELGATLDTCVDSAPGPDGIPYSYLKFFWQSFGGLLLDAWKYSLTTRELPPSHKVSYLRLIPKVGKDPRVISNLRPITLSNTDHKLITKTYSKKLTKIVSCSIGEEQTAYIPGRLINDNVRSMLMTIDLPNVDGILVSLDAKKAFDSVDHRYIAKCLEVFGLKSFVPIFSVLYKNLRSDIILNRKVVKGFDILKGVKQGDALSCIIFIMCIEPLIRNIKNNVEIQRIKSPSLRIRIPKIYGFADDVNVLTTRSQGSINQIFKEYEKLSINSGLKLNADKTEILCFNPQRANYAFSANYLNRDYVIQSRDQIKINGIFFTQDPAQREDANVRKVLDSMDKQLRMWSSRHLTLLGRILIIKTFAVSQLIYLAQTMDLGERSRKAATKIIFKYLWNRHYDGNRAPERIKRTIMLTPCKGGGFGLIDINEVCDSLHLRSYGRLINSNHPFLKQVAQFINAENFFNVTMDAPVDRKMRRSIELLNRDRKKMLNWSLSNLVADAGLCNVLTNSKIKPMLNRQGILSLNYFIIHQRARHRCFGQLTLREFDSIARFLIHQELVPVVKAIIRSGQQAVQIGQAPVDLYPINKTQVSVNIAGLSSKVLRLNNQAQDNIICLYKLGLVLTPGEVFHWTKQIKSLTSTRHKNIILRIAHGDIFSNERMCRFGLVDNPGCANCNEPIETITHRLLDCEKAQRAWQQLERVKEKLGLEEMQSIDIENALGTSGTLGKLELALNAEILHRLAAIGGKIYCPVELVKSGIKTIANGERLSCETGKKFEEVINGW